jgi:hypothetical protein
MPGEGDLHASSFEVCEGLPALGIGSRLLDDYRGWVRDDERH